MYLEKPSKSAASRQKM